MRDESAHLSGLYPFFPAHQEGLLEVGAGHCIAWEVSGKPDGVPVVFLHGGPGAGCQPLHRRFFDPAHYRIILLDQRGCGRSTPGGSLIENTTAHLVADLEALRRHLSVDRWILFGGSWGSTLALAYAVRHPERCLGLILRGVFLGRRREILWFLEGMGRFFPEAAQRFTAALPDGSPEQLLDAYYQTLCHGSPEAQSAAAQAWCYYELACSHLEPGDTSGLAPDRSVSRSVINLARIEAHYMRHDCFMPESYLLDQAAALAGIPGIIVQGRYDVVCPPESAYALSRAWPDAQLQMVTCAGHSALEPEIRTALVNATDRFRTISPAAFRVP